VNPTPLSPGQLSALVAVAFRELTWTLPHVRREVAAWRQRALRIPDDTLRDDALTSLRNERLNLEGAALFTSLPRHRDVNLLRLVVAYQVALDYLDRISERGSDDPIVNGRQLHLALTEALSPGAPLSDYYRHHPWHDDGGYLADLVRCCQRRCARLPGYARVHERVQCATRRVAVQILNHDPQAPRRDAALAAWAGREFPELLGTRALWFELTAAASSTVGIHALLALAADPGADDEAIAAADAAYSFAICAASTLLDSFVDQREDAATGNHSYVQHYDGAELAAQRIAEIVGASCAEARALRHGTRHALVAGGIVAMYLSKDDARDPALRATARRIRRAAGSLPCLQLPIMRALRVLRGLTDA
jgi:tetraprenyl-beta-curcumene synthase